jgi:hypothetical protein
LHDLHSNHELLVGEPDLHDEPSYPAWEESFSAEQRTDDIASLLERYPELRTLMDSLVPEKVSYTDFWKRYLYQKSKIDAEEAKRKQVFENSHDDNDFDWDGEDEEEGQGSESGLDGKNSTETVKAVKSTAAQQEEVPRNSSTSESSTSFDVVSLSSAVPPATKEKVFSGG